MPDAHHSTDLDALMHVIETLKERIEHDGGTIGSKEIRTRTALVDPLLNALGWDTTDPAMVIPEYAAGGGVADYALLKVMPDENTPVIAFIEAKRLNEPLESHRAQMLNYANMSGVKYAGLTNGDRWELYEVFKEAPCTSAASWTCRFSASPQSIARCNSCRSSGRAQERATRFMGTMLNLSSCTHAKQTPRFGSLTC